MQFVGTSLLYIMVNIFLNPRQNIPTNKERTASSLVDLARHTKGLSQKLREN